MVSCCSKCGAPPTSDSYCKNCIELGPAGIGENYTVLSFDVNGNFEPPPEALHGARLIPNFCSDMRTIVEHTFDKQHLRPLSARIYRAISLCSGAGVDSEAARMAGFRLVAAAEIDADLHEIYRDRFGVTPYGSNAELYKHIGKDIVLVTFGTECRSVSTAGPRDGLDRVSDWETFDAAVEFLEDNETPSFHYENSGALITNPKMGDVKQHILAKFGAHYVLKYGVADAANYGKGASRERTHIIGLRKDIADVVGFEAGGIATSPFKNAECLPKCVADYIVERKGEGEPDQIELEVWIEERKKTHDETWTIVWAAAYKSEESRRSIRRLEGCTTLKPITLGYVVLQGDRSRPGIDTHTGFKIGHVFGHLHGLTSVTFDDVRDQGPGGNSCFYFDPLEGRTRTLGALTIRRIWGLESWNAIQIKHMGKSAHPCTSHSSMLTVALYLDRYYAMTSSVPPTPRIAFDSIDDIYLPKTLTRIDRWKKEMSAFTAMCRNDPDTNFKTPKPLTITMDGLQFFARGWVFDLRGDKPKRVERLSRPRHSIQLSRLPGMEGYDDEDAFIICDYVGSSNNSNPPASSVWHGNDCGYIRNEEVALKQFREELGRGWIGVTEKVPYCPMWCNPHFMLWQNGKWRRIYNLSKECMGMSVNNCRVWQEKSLLRLVQHWWLVEQIELLMRKVLYLKGKGINCEIVLFVVDLWKAYNQLAVDLRDQWQTCGMSVNETGVVEFVELLRTSFGPENAPSIFARLTRCTTECSDRQLDGAGEDFKLQMEFRSLLKKDAEFGIEEIGDVLPETGLIPRSPRRETASSRKREKLEGTWRTQDWMDDLIPKEQLLQPGASVSRYDTDKLYAIATYLDDCFGAIVVPKALRGRVAHHGGTSTSNTTKARAAFAKRKNVVLGDSGRGVHTNSNEGHRGRVGGSSVHVGENLRHKFIREVYEKAGFIVVNDERSKLKHDAGRANTRMKILGCIYDLTNLENPTIELDAAKRARLKLVVSTILDNRRAGVELDEWQSLLGKLNDATRVAASGKVHTSGLFAAVRGVKRGRVSINAWATRNLIWWQKYFSIENALPTPLFKRKVMAPKQACVHSDASTGWGFGSFWIVDKVCYYIQEEWTPVEKEFMDKSDKLFGDKKMGINFLEMAAVYMTLECAKGRFQSKDFTFYCDNMTSVQILNSYKTRILPLATLLEKIDLNLTSHQLNIAFDHINTEDNVESDWLSRNKYREFVEYVRKNYDVSSFVHVKVPEEVRNIRDIVKRASENPEWIVADGIARQE